MLSGISRSLARYGTAILIGAAIWAAGALFVALPLGDGLLRCSYDSLYLFVRQHPTQDIAIIAINETTDHALGRRKGELFDRRYHAQLVERLKNAGCKRICYDVFFDLPSQDPESDDAFRKAIQSHGNVILGGIVESRRTDSTNQITVLPPLKTLRNACETWGILNVGPTDPDGIIRRFPDDWGLTKPMAVVAAMADAPLGSKDLAHPPANAWLQYSAPPGEIPQFEFSQCLDPKTLPDDLFRGKTVFVGGNYSTDGSGIRDAYRTPYSRFGGGLMPGVEWHANVYISARDQRWFRVASRRASFLWCLPLALAGLMVIFNSRPFINLGIFLIIGATISVVAIYSAWSSLVFFPWLIPLAVQLPAIFGIQSAHSFLRTRFRYLEPIAPSQFDDLDVFISFAIQDVEIAEDICGMLNDTNRKAWICTEHIRPGAKWPRSLATAIEKCRVVVFLVSKKSVQSGFCDRELQLAGDLKKPIIPVALDSTTLPSHLRIFIGTRQIIHASGVSRDALMQQIFHGVDSELHQSPPTDLEGEIKTGSSNG